MIAASEKDDRRGQQEEPEESKSSWFNLVLSAKQVPKKQLQLLSLSLLPTPWNFSGGPVTLSYIYSHIYVLAPQIKVLILKPKIFHHFWSGSLYIYFRHTVFPPSPPKKKKKNYDANAILGSRGARASRI